MCEPDLGYYLVAEYSPTVKHGAAANIPLIINKDLVLPQNTGGATPALQQIIPFEKCDKSCFICRGTTVDDCTSCSAGKSFSLSAKYVKSDDTFPFGKCDI
jgi:hypothetical protein